MTSGIANAPGKIFLGGEYAVLTGAEAVVAAVDRRATAKIADSDRGFSPIAAVVRKEVSRFFGEKGVGAGELPFLDVSSDKFHVRRKKMGLGSSAAVAAAACGAYFELAGLPIADHRPDILRIAGAAHKEAQGGRGSGADVAASIIGGVIVFAMDGRLESIAVKNVEIAVVFSGKTASTMELLERIDEFADRDSKGYRFCLGDLNAGAAKLASAFRADDPDRIIEAMGDYGKSMERLGRASGVELVTREHKLIARLASDCGGSAKPSGAGGGDIAVAVFRDRESSERFQRNCLRHELVPIDISIGAEGLRRGD